MLSATSSSDSDQKHLILVDGYGFVFRAYHSLPPLTRPDGTPIGAVLGFTNMLMKLKSDAPSEDGTYMAVVLDAGAKTFRNTLYKEYKANRPPAPEDLIPQFPLIHEAVAALNLPTLHKEGYEADDIIATYARQARKLGFKVTIVSSDKDLMQLVDDQIELYDAMKNKHIGIKQVEEKFGVKPEKVIDVQALMGDSSDNIPGVPGIGPKTASELINTFGTLDAVLERAEEITQNKRRESLIAHRKDAELSRELVTLCDTVPMEETIEDFAVRGENPELLLSFLREQGFKSLIARVEKQHGVTGISAKAHSKAKPSAKKASGEDVLITGKKALQDWLQPVVNEGKLAFYLEPDTGLALARMDGNACYIPLFHKKAAAQGSFDLGDGNGSPGDSVDQLDIATVITLLTPLFKDPALLKTGHDFKQLSHMLGITPTPIDDIMVMSYVLDGASHKHDLPTLAELHLDEDLALPDEIAKEKGGLSIQSPDVLMAPLCKRARAVSALQRQTRERLFTESMLSVYETIERPLIPILTAMEDEGIKVDSDALRKISDEFTKRISVLEKDIHALSGKEFNIGSPKQLGEILFEELGIEGGKASKKSGAYSTGADVLEELSAQGHTIAEKVLAWRELSKLKSTYADALPKQINPKTGRIHSTFAMTVANTGRLSSVNPNLQNIPIRTEEGRRIRHAFVAEKGHKLISADYSQIELRLLAHMADIGSLKDAFKRGEDIHKLTASQVFGMTLAEVDGEHRRRAKAINFGIIYGQSAFGLANALGIGRAEAKAYIDAYFTQYPGIRAYMDGIRKIAHEQGYVTTVYGRKCYLSGINAKGPQRAFAERAAINAPLQGTAADIIKKAMIHLPGALKKAHCSAKMILQVHDELLLEAPEKEAQQAADIVKKVMETVTSLDVPTPVETSIGDNWGDIH